MELKDDLIDLDYGKLTLPPRNLHQTVRLDQSLGSSRVELEFFSETVSPNVENPPPLPPKRRTVTGGQHLFERLKSAGYDLSSQTSLDSTSSQSSVRSSGPCLSPFEGVTFEIVETTTNSHTVPEPKPLDGLPFPREVEGKVVSYKPSETLDFSPSLPYNVNYPSPLERNVSHIDTGFRTFASSGNSSVVLGDQRTGNTLLDSTMSSAFSTPSSIAGNTNFVVIEGMESAKHAHFVKRDASLSRASFRGPQIVPPMQLGRVTKVDNVLSIQKEFQQRFEQALRNKDDDLINRNILEFENNACDGATVLLQSSEKKDQGLPMMTSLNRKSSSLDDLLTVDVHKKTLKHLSAEDLEQLLIDESKREKPEEIGTGLNKDQHSCLEDKESIVQYRNPPERPPGPKMQHRFSAPLGMNALTEQSKRSQIKSEQYDDLFFGDGMFDVVEERNEEAVAFCRAVAELRKLYRFSDTTNPGYVSCARFKCNPAFLAYEQKIWKVVMYLDPYPQCREFMCNLTLKSNEVVAHGLSLFQGHFSDIDCISDQFVLKVNGMAMYIDGNFPLIDHEYIQECLRLETDINLRLIQKSKINRELARTKEDDAEEFLGKYFKHFFENPAQTAVSRQGLLILLEAYNNEVAKLLAEVTDTQAPRYVPDRLIQTVKAISLSLSYVETSQLQEAIKLLVMLKPKGSERKTYSLSRKGMKDFNRYLDPDRFDKGRFHLGLEKLTNSVSGLVSLYCKAFDTDFCINKIGNQQKAKSDTTERLDIRLVHDKFSTRVGSVHRIPHDWKSLYDYFEVECGLYYGAKLLCPRLLTKLSKPCEGFFEQIRWDELLIFDIKTSDLPRETRICICLYALMSAKRGGESKSRNLLGWVVRNLFDFHGLLLSGSYLFGLLNSGDPNPAATCATNYIQHPGTIVMKVDFEVYHSDVIFPELFIPPIAARSASNLYLPEPDTLLQLEQVLSNDCTKSLTEEEKSLLWKSRVYCRHIPKALSFVLASAPGWDAEAVAEIHDLVSSWEPLVPTMALELLKADFPDGTVRKYAIQWLATISDDELCDYLPQLVQGLKYESYHNSELARYLIRKALSSPRIAHYLFWHLKYYIGDPQFCQRFQITLGGLLSVCGNSLRDQLSRQDQMVQMLEQIGKRVKESKESVRLAVLKENLSAVSAGLNFCFRLPTDPACKVSDILYDECAFFNSFTVPLSLVFKNADPKGDKISLMFKMGDDLRKDLITLQLFQVMNKLWLSEGLDLKMMTYHCMPTGPLAGMVQLIQASSTLREIHIQYGVTGSFKEESVSLWLQKFNTSETEYKKAVKNFTASCAGCCVATYVLGIGDRHNDNVMISQKGHMFHIDFSKFMGNTQKFGSIKRDRVPFVFTPDMAFVINGGETTSSNFQQFVECCCQAFNIIRHHASLILNLLGLMVSSGIPYLSQEEDLEYVRQSLQLQLSDSEAMSYFTRLIESSLTSKTTQLNFFIHNVAHIKDVGQTLLHSNRRLLYSFTNKIYSAESDGELMSARVVDFQKRYAPEKHYIFVINVVRKGQQQPSFVFRKFDEFQELNDKITNLFSNTQIPQFPSKIFVGRSQVRDVAVRRRRELDQYLERLMKIPTVLRSEVLYTFLHSYIRDEQDTAKFSEILEMLEEGGPKSRVGGELKFSYHFNEGVLSILVMHARNLIPRSIQGSADPYVKAYLLPDPSKSTKRKTKVIRKNLNPTFNETISYQMPLSLLQRRVLQVSVWDHDTIRDNLYLGGVNVYLSTVDLSKETISWYKLKELGR